MVGGLGLSADEQLALQVIVEGTGRFNRDMNRIDRRIEGTSRGWSNMGGIVSGALATAFGIALVKAIDAAFDAMRRLMGAGLQYTKDAIQDAADFEYAITLVDIAARDAGVGIDELEQAAFELGKDIHIVGVDALEAAEGLETLYLAGVDTDVIFGEGGLQSTLEGVSRTTGAFKSSADLAAASTLDLDRAANLAVVTITTFANEAAEAGGQADFLHDSFNTIVAVADSTTAEIADFEGALKNVGPTAAGLGYEFTEVAEAIGILADRGIRGREAGTALRRMLANLNRDVKKVHEANEELGVSLFDQEGQLRSLQDVFNDYSKVLSTDSDSAVTSTIYLKDATAEQTRQYHEAIEVLEKMNTKIADHNAGLAILSDTTLEKYYQQQANANAIIADYNDLSVTAKEVTTQLTEEERARYVQTLAGVYGQNAFNALIGDGSDQFAALQEEMATATTLGDRVTQMAETGRGEFERLTSILDTLKIQYGDLFLDALKEGIIIMREWLEANDEWIQSGLERLGEVIGDLAATILPKFFDFLQKLPERIAKLQEIWDKLRSGLETGGSWIQDNLIPILDKFREWFELVKPIIADIVDTEINARMIPAFEAIKKVIQDDVMPILESLGEVIDEYLPIAIEHFGKLWESFLKPALELLGKFVSNVLIPVIGKLIKIIGVSLVESLKGWAKIYFERIAPLVEDLFEWLGQNLIPVIEDLVNWLAENLVPALEEFATWVMEEGLPAVMDFYDSIVENLIEAVSDLVAWVKEDLIPAIEDLATWITETAIPALTEFYEMLRDKIVGAIETVTTWIEETLIPLFESLTTTTAEDVVPALGTLHEWLNEYIVPIFETFSELVSEVASVITMLAESALQAYVIPALEKLQDIVNEHVIPALQKLREWVEDKVGIALEWLNEEVIVPIQERFQELVSFFEEVLIPILTVFYDQIKEEVGAALEWLNEEVIVPVIGALEDLWVVIDEVVLPTLEKLREFVEEKIGAALLWFKDTVISGLTIAVDGLEKSLLAIKSALEGAIAKLRAFKDNFTGFDVPEFLQRESPPPLYTSLKEIEGAMDDISRRAAPEFSRAMASLPAPAFAMGTTVNNNRIENNQQYNLNTSTLLRPGELALEFQEMQMARR